MTKVTDTSSRGSFRGSIVVVVVVVEVTVIAVVVVVVVVVVVGVVVVGDVLVVVVACFSVQGFQSLPIVLLHCRSPGDRHLLVFEENSRVKIGGCLRIINVDPVVIIFVSNAES